MTLELFDEIGLSPALALLPSAMDKPEARAMILSIALQESQLQARRQFGHGPARSYAMFELTGGIEGVLTHAATRGHARRLCLDLDIGPTAPAVYEAIEFNDVLAAGFARLNLWWLPQRLPAQTMPEVGWSQYLQTWNPGKPRVETWDENWHRAWALVQPC